MSVQAPSKDQNTNAIGSAFKQAATNARPEAQAQQADTANRPQQMFSWRQTGSRLAMSRTPAAENLTRLMEAMQKIIDARHNKEFDILLSPIDLAQTTNLIVSAIVMSVRSSINPALGVAHHTYILESTLETITPRQDSWQGAPYETIRVPGDACDSAMMEHITKVAGDAFAGTRKLLNGGCEVVPAGFDITSEELVYNLTANGTTACSVQIENEDKEVPELCLMNIDKNVILQVQQSFANKQLQDSSSNPVRADIQMEFTASAINNGQQQQNERVTRIASAAGFLDLVYNPAFPQQGNFMAGAYMPQQNNFQTYSVRFVLTRLFAENLLTLPAQLVAIVSTLSLRENNSWIHTFNQKTYGSDLNMHDIGAVGIEANLENNPTGFGSRIDTQAASFTPENLAKLITTTVQPGLHYSIDIPEVAESSWYLDVWAAAADGSQKAIGAIIRSADILTGGLFSRNFNPAAMTVCTDENNRILLGTYTGRDGLKHDLRDIDYLAVANLVGDKDPNVIRRWSDTYLNRNKPIDLRLHERKQILMSLVEGVKITGRARRVTISPEFLNALQLSVDGCNLRIRPVNNMIDMSAIDRPTGNFLNNQLVSSMSSGVFNRATMAGNGAMGYAGRSNLAGRW